MSSESKFCTNCKKDIAAANFTMHEVHCRRHLVLCKICQEPVPRSEENQHFNDVHAKVPCVQCQMDLEKDQMEDHLKNDCPKRQVHCEYCELQLPQSDLAAHVEFCGTRTEPCPRCNSFIMHKDLLRHNSSNCSYPEARAPPPSATVVKDPLVLGRFRHGEIFRGMDSFLDPFELEQIRRALDGEEHDILVEDSDAPALNTLVPRGSVGRGKLSTQTRTDNDSRGSRQEKTNKHSEVNYSRQQVSLPPDIPPDMDYDSLLAMQLEAEEAEDVPIPLDPDPDELLNKLISSYDNRTSRYRASHKDRPKEKAVFVSSSPPPYNNFDIADADMIPCEFCKETFPAFALVHHQSVCDHLASGLFGYLQEPVLPLVFERNNTSQVSTQLSPTSSRPPPIPVINNLRASSPPPWTEPPEEVAGYHLTDNGDHDDPLDSLENIMLPCEFCDELLPADSLVQHQAICEGSITPRVKTPTAAPQSTHNVRKQYFPTDSPYKTKEEDASEMQAGLLTERLKKHPNLPVTDQGSFTGTDARAPVTASRLVEHSRRGHERHRDLDLFSSDARLGQTKKDGGKRREAQTLPGYPRAAGQPVGHDAGDSDIAGRRWQAPSRRSPAIGNGLSTRSTTDVVQQRDRVRSEREHGSDETEPAPRRARQRGDHLFNASDESYSQGRQRRSNQPDRR